MVGKPNHHTHRIGIAHSVEHITVSLMNTIELTRTFLLLSSGYLPTLLVSLVGIVLLTKWRQAIGGSLWAFLGFGLALFLCFAMPVGRTVLQQWLLRSLHSSQHSIAMRAYIAFGLTGSILQAIIYLFLLVAICSGRRKPRSPNGPSLNCT